MRKRDVSALCAGLICAALMACTEEKVAGGTGIGNPGGTAEFAVLATSSAPLAKISAGAPRIAGGTVRNPDSSFSVPDAGGTVFTIRKAFVNIDGVRIRLPDGETCEHASGVVCESGDIRLPGPFISDLMTGVATPAIDSFTVPAGNYMRVELRLEAMLPGAPTPEPALEGHSMFIAGNFDYAGKADRIFSIALDFNEATPIESGTGMTVQDSGVTRMLVLLKVDDWLANTNITQCLNDKTLALDSAGNLAIDKDHTCGNIDQMLRDGIRGSCGLGQEHHDDPFRDRSGPH